ncbi:MAG TPA: hypothetical protein VGD44_08600 [Phenylobacterium sp.]
MADPHAELTAGLSADGEPGPEVANTTAPISATRDAPAKIQSIFRTLPIGGRDDGCEPMIAKKFTDFREEWWMRQGLNL